MKPSVIAVAALLAALTAVFLMSRRGGSAPMETQQPAVAVETSSAPKAVEAPRKETPSPVVPKRRGITVCRFDDGSTADPAAPPLPAAAYERLREAALSKWRAASITMTRDETTIRKVVAEIERVAGLHVGLDPAVPDSRSLSLSITGANGEDAISLIADVFELAWVIDKDGASWLVPQEKAALYECAEARELKEIERIAGVLETQSSPGKGDERARQIASILDSKRVTVSLKDATLNQAMGIMAAVHSVPLNWDRESIPDSKAIKVSVEAKDATAREVLTSMLEPVGLGFSEDNGTILIATQEALERRAVAASRKAGSVSAAAKEAVDAEAEILGRTVVIDGDSLAIRDVAERVSKALGIGYVIDPATWNRTARYGFDGEPHTLREIFAALAKGAPVRVTYREGKLWFLAASSGK
jgi:hypothetical protein